MAEPHEPEPVQLFVGLLWSEPAIEPLALERLTATHGPLVWQSEIVPWNYSRYYTTELGGEIHRRFLTLGPPISPEQLPEIKLACNALEKELASENGVRRINIDPGWLSLDNLVLASTKHAPHRIAIGQHIYAELTLIYHKGAYRTLPWTYPDYADAVDGFLEARACFKRQR